LSPLPPGRGWESKVTTPSPPPPPLPSFSIQPITARESIPNSITAMLLQADLVSASMQRGHIFTHS
jgi:hypothetical protein